MSLVIALKAYLTLNILCVFVVMMLTVAARFRRATSFRSELQFAYIMTGAMLLVPVLSALFAPQDFIQPTSQIFSAETMRGPSSVFSDPGRIAVSVTPGSGVFSAYAPAAVILLLLLCGITAATLRTLWSFFRLSRLIAAAITVRRTGCVRILVSDRISVPFSFWLPFRAFIVIPESLVSNAEHLRLAVAHEIQHHRQRDTLWLHALTGLKAFTFWNPFVHIMDRKISHLQEFACDEALAGHRGISSLAYCRCLLWVAEKSLQPVPRFAGTAGMTGGSAGKVLKRRIELMMISRREKVRKHSLAVIGTLGLTILSGVAMVANASIQDRRITHADAIAMAESAQTESGFPIVVNDLVLAQLNRYLGTPDGREFFRRSLAEMENHRAVVATGITRYNLPVELMAVPIVESGYRNRPQGSNPAHGAGIWMFIATTARHYGLRVDATIDERMNVVKETEAAMRLLSALHLRFKDWGLALLGYNAGAGLVNKGIRETGSRDVWHLVRSGYENDPDYTAKVMAAVLILKNPTSLD